MPTEVEFLKDQVHRMSSVLREYQRRYPPLDNLPEKSVGPPPPWVLDQSMVSPLIVEYEAYSRVMKGDLENNKDIIARLKDRVKRLVDENERLGAELRMAVESGGGAGVVNLPPAVRGGDSVGVHSLPDTPAVENINIQLQLMTKERDSAQRAWETSRGEVERLEEALCDYRTTNITKAQYTELRRESEQIRMEYVGTIAELNREIHSLRAHLRRSEGEGVEIATAAKGMKEDIRHLKTAIGHKDRERTLQSDQKGRELERQIDELQTNIESQVSRERELIDQIGALQKEVEQRHSKSGTLESEVYEATLRMKEALLLAETAARDRDEALVRESQGEESLRSLKAEVSALVEKAGQRTKQEVEQVQSLYNQKMARLVDDLHTSEMESSSRQSQLERAIREKRAVESELEKVYEEGVQAHVKDGGKYDQLNQRACLAESQVQELRLKLDSLHASCKRDEASREKECLKHVQEISRLTERLDGVMRDLERVDEDRVRATEEASETDKRYLSQQQAKESLERHYLNQIVSLEDQNQSTRDDFVRKLQCTDDSHRETVNELRQTMNSHLRSSSRWKERCESIARDHEVTSSNLKSECDEKSKRALQLSALLKEAQEKACSAERSMKEYLLQVKKMDGRVREADLRASQAMQENARKDAKVRQLVQEVQYYNGAGGRGFPTVQFSDNNSHSRLKSSAHRSDEEDNVGSGGDLSYSRSPISHRHHSTSSPSKRSRRRQGSHRDTDSGDIDS